jgi:hypothetical protein
VTVISAPAGSGKTSLLRAWPADRASRAGPFVQVQRGQQDAQQFGPTFRHGKLYALEASTTAGEPTPGTGRIVRVTPHRPAQTVVSHLTFPTGMTVGPDGAFYVSTRGFGFGARADRILRIQPSPQTHKP